MSYCIQAIIAKESQIKEIVPNNSLCVPLSQGYALFPLVERISEDFKIDILPLTDCGHKQLPLQFSELCIKASTKGRCAYIEAEYFGGAGGQAHVKWKDGRVVGEPCHSQLAINEALAFIGVVKDSGKDEFDTLELGKFRDTNLWEIV